MTHDFRYSKRKWHYPILYKYTIKEEDKTYELHKSM